MQAPAHDRIYQRQWAQEANGPPQKDYRLIFEDLGEEALMQHSGIPLGSPMELVEHWQRASNHGDCVEFALYAIRLGHRGFVYTLNEPVRVGKDFQSLRTATLITSRASTNRIHTIQKVGMVRQSRKFFQDALNVLRESGNPTIPKKELIAVDSTFVYDQQVKFHLQVVNYPGSPEERPSKFLLAFKSMEVVLQLLYEEWLSNSRRPY